MIPFKKIRERRSKFKMVKVMNGYIAVLGTNVLVMLQAIDDVEARKGSHEDFFQHITVFMQIRFAMIDIMELYKIYFNCSDFWERNLLMRTAAIHAYEFFQNTGKLIGYTMNKHIEKIKDPLIEQSLKNLRIQFNSLKKKFESRMHEIRNAVSAHKDRNIRAQLEVINSIDDSEFDIFMVWFQLFTAQFVLFEKERNDRIFRKIREKQSL